MAKSEPGEAGGGKGRCVGSLWVTLGALFFTFIKGGGKSLLTNVNNKMDFFNEGFPKATIVHIRVTLGHPKVTIGFFFYKQT